MKKLIALMLSILMVCSLAACASKQDSASASTETASTEASGEEKTLTMATNVAFPPYEFYENEQPAGIDVDIATAICEKLGYKLEIMDIEFGAILGAVSSGKADFTMAGLTVTEERKQSVDFSSSYATGIQSIIVKEDSPITTVDDLYADGADYQIGVQQDTTGDIYCSDDFGDDHVQRFNKGAAVVLGAACCAEARHGYAGYHAAAYAHFVRRRARHQQRKRAVQPPAYAYNKALCMNMLRPAHKRRPLQREKPPELRLSLIRVV